MLLIFLIKCLQGFGGFSPLQLNVFALGFQGIQLLLQIGQLGDVDGNFRLGHLSFDRGLLGL